MTVYVDALAPSVVSRRWRHPKACHMVADSLEELPRRRVAVQFGAIEIGRDQVHARIEAAHARRGPDLGPLFDLLQ